MTVNNKEEEAIKLALERTENVTE